MFNTVVKASAVIMIYVSTSNSSSSQVNTAANNCKVASFAPSEKLKAVGSSH